MCDIRNFSADLPSLSIPASGSALLNLFADQHLQTLYLTGKGEGVTVVEYDKGRLILNSFPKVEKQFV